MTDLQMKRLSDTIKEHFDDVLEDDETPYGGTSFEGETLRDFLYDVDVEDNDIPDISISGINESLIACGIVPITA